MHCAGAHTDGNQRGAPLEEKEQSSLPDPPPTHTLLNPITCYRLGKSIWSQAQREMLKCSIHFEVRNGIRLLQAQRMHPALVHDKTMHSSY